MFISRNLTTASTVPCTTHINPRVDPLSLTTRFKLITEDHLDQSRHACSTLGRFILTPLENTNIASSLRSLHLVYHRFTRLHTTSFVVPLLHF